VRIPGTGILNGMRITFTNMLRGPITVQYPKERIELPERARWAVAAKFDEQGIPKCTACTQCVRACPDFILELDVDTDPETKVKHINHFSYQMGACMMCGLCVEACPYDALEMSHDYELARTSPTELEYDLLADVDAAKIKRTSEGGENA
jgi:formate hydrogenlyase subunit 6/NADH:ubiquinone oxidoreductase subunit I